MDLILNAQDVVQYNIAMCRTGYDVGLREMLHWTEWFCLDY